MPTSHSKPAVALERRAAADVAIQMVGRLGNLALGVVVTVLIVRSLGARGYGQWTTIFAVTLVASSFGDLGLETVAVGRAAAEPESAPRWLGALLLLRGALSIPVTLATAGAILAISSSGAMRAAGLVITLTCLLSPYWSFRMIFQLRMRNDWSVALTTFNSVVWGVAVVIIVATGGGMVRLAIAFVGTSVLTLVLGTVLALRMGTVDFRRARSRAGLLMRIGLPVSAAGLLVTGYVRVDQVLMFELAGGRQAGLYAASYRILDQAQFVPVAVMTTLYPLIASAYPADLPRVRRLAQQAAEYLLMISLPALAFAIVEGSQLMSLLFGRAFAPAGPALAILLAAYVAIALGHLVGTLRIVLGLQRRFVAYAAAGLTVNVALNLALIPAYGFIAAAIVTLVTEVLVLFLTARAVMGTLSFTPPLSRIVRILAAATVTGLALVGARAVGVGPVAGALITVVLYAGLLFACGALTVSQVRFLLNRQPAAGAS